MDALLDLYRSELRTYRYVFVCMWSFGTTLTYLPSTCNRSTLLRYRCTTERVPMEALLDLYGLYVHS